MWRALAAALFGMAVAATSQAGEVTVDTAAGPVVVQAKPARVAVFDVAAIDTITALGVPIAGVPDRLYLKRLAPVAESAQIVGTLFQPDLEAMAILQPDLIVVGGRSSPHAKELAAFAPTIDMTISSLGDARARIEQYGAIFGVEGNATALLGEVEAKFEAAREAVVGKGKALILLTNGGKISAYGPGSRFGWLHTELGLAEAAPGLKASVHGHAISFEFVAEVDPDWLLVIDRGSAIGAPSDGARATLDNPLVASTKAARAGRIVYLSSAPIYIAAGGAASMMTTLDEIIAAFSGQGS